MQILCPLMGEGSIKEGYKDLFLRSALVIKSRQGLQNGHFNRDAIYARSLNCIVTRTPRSKQNYNGTYACHCELSCENTNSLGSVKAKISYNRTDRHLAAINILITQNFLVIFFSKFSIHVCANLSSKTTADFFPYHFDTFISPFLTTS